MITALVVAVTLAISSAASPNVFEVQTELQALYDEITNGTAQFMTPADVDLFHSVLYAPDFVFVDKGGTTHEWPEMRALAIEAIGMPLPDSSIQSIQKVTLVTGGAAVLVHMTAVRTIVDKDGTYGHKGATHTLTEFTPFRDLWVRADSVWKMKRRTQIGATTVGVDKQD
jgi:hypothetical protein